MAFNYEWRAESSISGLNENLAGHKRPQCPSWSSPPQKGFRFAKKEPRESIRKLTCVKTRISQFEQSLNIIVDIIVLFCWMLVTHKSVMKCLTCFAWLGILSRFQEVVEWFVQKFSDYKEMMHLFQFSLKQRGFLSQDVFKVFTEVSLNWSKGQGLLSLTKTTKTFNY